ncbi:hypothetical protein BT67DRAFT_14253 [Trichocladium antarcticum]|uniref:Uncharacterized protein n=1 Tax=Trichocladium antarcticum TaxID=1450529 RepID=A0AAN6ZID7_9PEZI|nr:hypothetical protein BT67DRAFT_14253 [Trichocladium antarcticum]
MDPATVSLGWILDLGGRSEKYQRRSLCPWPVIPLAPATAPLSPVLLYSSGPWGTKPRPRPPARSDAERARWEESWKKPHIHPGFRDLALSISIFIQWMQRCSNLLEDRPGLLRGGAPAHGVSTWQVLADLPSRWGNALGGIPPPTTHRPMDGRYLTLRSPQGPITSCPLISLESIVNAESAPLLHLHNSPSLFAISPKEVLVDSCHSLCFIVILSFCVWRDSRT